jgi:hypothetical protein
MQQSLTVNRNLCSPKEGLCKLPMLLIVQHLGADILTESIALGTLNERYR